jgi:glutathione S-transferase
MIIIHGATLSPFVRKTVVFAAEKGLDFKLVPHAGPNGPTPEFRAASPFGKMPAMQDGDFAISDSTAIIAYMDAIKPDPNLIPTEPKARARTIWFEEYGDTLVAGCVGKIFFNRVVSPRFFGKPGDLAAADEAQKTEFPRLVDYLESIVPASGYLVEDRFTLADIAVASPFQNMRLAGCSIDAARYPKSAKYVEAILARPSYAGWVAQERKMFAAA